MEPKKTILLIDDEADFINSVKFGIANRGYNVLTATDGQSGLEIVQDTKPHLIILDIRMPKMDGIEFYDRICGSEKRPQIPILVLTARHELRDFFKDIDADGFMAKPFQIDEPYNEIDIIMSKRYGITARRKLRDPNVPKKVLIVEDDQETSDRLALAFLNSGYTVNSSSSGISAIEKALADVPDLVVIKLGLPDLSGDLVIAKLKQMPKTMDLAAVVYVSEDSDPNCFIENKICKGAGLRHIVLPGDPKDLLGEAEIALEETGR